MTSLNTSILQLFSCASPKCVLVALSCVGGLSLANVKWKVIPPRSPAAAAAVVGTADVSVKKDTGSSYPLIMATPALIRVLWLMFDGVRRRWVKDDFSRIVSLVSSVMLSTTPPAPFLKNSPLAVVFLPSYSLTAVSSPHAASCFPCSFL